MTQRLKYDCQTNGLKPWRLKGEGRETTFSLRMRVRVVDPRQEGGSLSLWPTQNHKEEGREGGSLWEPPLRSCRGLSAPRLICSTGAQRSVAGGTSIQHRCLPRLGS